MIKVIKFDIDNIPDIKDRFVLCLGYFDGVHIGHQNLIKKAVNEGYKTALLTFDNSPSDILKIRKEKDCLTSDLDKEEILNSLGVDYLLIMRFDERVMKIDCDAFYNNVLKRLNPIKIFVGSDYTFGYKGLGTPQTIKDYKEIETEIVNLIQMDNKKISSREIRKLIKEGNIKLANQQLGRLYRISGVVVKGKQNGRTIDFPTANLEVRDPYVTPKEGVYSGYAYIDDKQYQSLICISTHPTIDELNKPIIEINIINFNNDVYDKEIKVEFNSFIRDIKTFSSLLELKEQIELDLKKAKKELQ